LKKVLSIRKELWQKLKSPSKLPSQDAIAFTWTFDGLMAHMPNFTINPNGKINTSLKADQTWSKE
jgi:hypothetical protein